MADLPSNEPTLVDDLNEGHLASEQPEFVNHITPIMVRHAQELYQRGFLAGLRAERARRSVHETPRKPDGYLVQYGDRVSAYAASLDSNVFENLKSDGIAHTVTPLFAIPVLGAAVWVPPKTSDQSSGKIVKEPQ